MKSAASRSFLKILCALGVLSVGNLLWSLDREAFSITNYDLTLQIDPAQHRLGARGKITLRNDTNSPQKIAVLQISSSLDWRTVKAGDKEVQFVTQAYASDIDHTGALSEVIVTLPEPVASHAFAELNVGYEGVVVVDATRLIRVGTPEDIATGTDWDQIGPDFSAVRGAGYVAWYPIATESANLSEEGDLSSVLQRWKSRESECQMSVVFESTKDAPILFSGSKNGFVIKTDKPVKIGAFSMIRPHSDVPTFVIADYKQIEAKNDSTISFLPGKDATAASLADVLGNLEPIVSSKRQQGLQIAELRLPDAQSYVTQNLLLTPLRPMTQRDRLTLVYALARQSIPSPRQWITEGIAHFEQALEVERQHGRKAALDYLDAHRSAFVEKEVQAGSSDPTGDSSAAGRSLINTSDDLYLQSKAMSVWWMLHDMIGDISLKLVWNDYSDLKDKDPSYMPRLIGTYSHRDLEWFFDDWVYRDHGLPDFKVESASARKTVNGAYMVAVTVANLGSAGAEVPLTVKFKAGEVSKRLEVRAKDKATIRIETPTVPLEVIVNDGSVPETDTSNNTFKVEAPKD